MTVTVLYFAAIRDLAGKSEETMDLPPEVTTVGAFAAHLCSRLPALTERLGHVRIARNEMFAQNSDPVAHGDVLALIPPVAGG
jgi:molybdopterin converting factor subunit 1